MNKFRRKKTTATQIDSRLMHCLLMEKKKRNMISKFNHKTLALSMSSTNVSKNRYRSISLNLMLKQNIVITITTWETILFILSPSFLSISAHALHISHHVVLKCCLLPVGLIGLKCFNFCGLKVECLSFYFCFCFLLQRTYFCQNLTKSGLTFLNCKVMAIIKIHTFWLLDK